MITLSALDGLELQATLYEPAQPCQATLLALPGIGVPRRVFRHIGPWLSSHGLRVVTLDYRGMFGSGGRRGLETASLTAWARLDAAGAIRDIEQRCPGPLALLAHSYAGQMAGLVDDFRKFQAVVTVGSGFGQPHHFSGRTRAFVTTSWYLTLPVVSRFAAQVPGWLGLGERLPAGVAREWARWGRHPDWLLGHVAGARARYARFDRPILALDATDDDIGTVSAANALFAQYTGAAVERLRFTPEEVGRPRLGHSGLFKPEAATRVWPRILDHVRLQLPELRLAG